MRIFISHSHEDKDVARKLVDLLERSLALRPDDIRCTSLDGYKLHPGYSIHDVIRAEVEGAELLIGLITPTSLESSYMPFELGARWGAEKSLLPLLACGATTESLQGPLTVLSALNCSSQGDVLGLVEEANRHLSIDQPNAPSSYLNLVQKLVEASVNPVRADAEADLGAWTEGQEGLGFRIRTSRTEIRFVDWDADHHSEVYEKHLEVMPIEDRELLTVDIMSGSSSVKDGKDMDVQGTHERNPVSDGDGYHTLSRVKIADAKKGELREIFEKSRRDGLSNVSTHIHGEVSAHPIIRNLGIEPHRWYVVFHVLHPTDRLALKATFEDGHHISPSSVEVARFGKAKLFPVKNPKRRIISDQGPLQVLTWEIEHVPADTDYVLTWQWKA